MGARSAALACPAPEVDVVADVAAHAPDVVIRFGADGTVEWVSPSIEPVLGYSPDHILGRRMRLSVQGDRESVAEEFRRAIAAGDHVVRTRRQIARADGTVLWTDTAARIVRDDEGRLRAIVAAIREVSRATEVPRPSTSPCCPIAVVVMVVADGDTRRRLAVEFAGADVRVTAACENSVADQVRAYHPDASIIDPHHLTDPRGDLRHIVEVAEPSPVLIVADAHDEATIVGSLSLGASGVILSDRPQDARRVACAALAGEVAVPRSVTGMLVAALRSHDLTQHGVGRLAHLTGRERLTLDLLAQGLSTRQIADEFVVAPVTVRGHAAAAIRKLGVDSRAEAVAMVRRLTMDNGA